MPISELQIEQFKNQTFPGSVNLTRTGEHIYRGKEALVTKTGSGSTNYAFKWYANLEGSSTKKLIDYGTAVNKDEALLYKVGLGGRRVLDSHFFVSEFNKKPQLFAIQPWSDGQTLRDIPFWQIISNPQLRQSLAEIFINCEKSYRLTDRQPDLTGGKRVSFFGKDFVEPWVFLWPFRTTNILIENDQAVLVDAKALNQDPSYVKKAALSVNRLISIFFAKVFLMAANRA